MRILLAEDERDLNRIITKKLTSAGYSVDSFFDGEEAIQVLSYTEYDALILDIMMPKADGYAVLRAVRDAGKTTPVCSSRPGMPWRTGLRASTAAPTTIWSSPFSFEELLARIRAMTRTSFGVKDSLLTIADITLDSAAQTVRRAGRELTLSAKEYALLEYLMHNQGIILSREKIENHIWNLDYEGGTNVVDVYISYLRKKIDEGREKKLIHTVRGRGYVLREEP